MNHRTLTARTPVFFTGDQGPDHLRDAITAVNSVSFCPWTIRDAEQLNEEGNREIQQIGGMAVFVPAGWVLVGYADVTLHLNGEKELVAHKVEALQAKRREVLAEAQAQVTQIDRQINTLLAIDYTPSEVAQ